MSAPKSDSVSKRRTPALSTYDFRFSVGRQQCVAAARAPVGPPDLILADGPAWALDDWAKVPLCIY